MKSLPLCFQWLMMRIIYVKMLSMLLVCKTIKCFHFCYNGDNLWNLSTKRKLVKSAKSLTTAGGILKIWCKMVLEFQHFSSRKQNLCLQDVSSLSTIFLRFPSELGIYSSSVISWWAEKQVLQCTYFDWWIKSRCVWKNQPLT